ncbi:U6 snRNA phosphodiesterase isoform X3 [Siniperca chuatsi]|nr:U6 snRNA phosphodiesterase isoform X3 [Siniperca chuatsi]XP_044050594.1 U6 snRNA phosphodiesterase isoform X3 [Siniperca chuatsi]XP_044050595.1 U6 snRNA phosphodiesterase isoform X3 [Siniperca chuatsi]
MLVGYSSSSEEESEAADQSKSCSRKCQEEDDGDDGCPARKKPKNEERVPKTSSLPLPGCLLAMFPEEVDSQTEDSALHGGRIRSFKHERGNWATYVYLPYHPEEEFRELLEALLSVARAHGAVLTPQEEFHLSLSQTVVLRHHWIQPFTQSLRAGLVHCKRFVCSAGRLRVYCNAERTRTFLGMEVCTGHAQLLDLVQAVDRTMTEFRLDTFYKDPSFHVSLAWCVGDMTGQMKECIQELQSLVDDHEDGPFLLRLDCVELRCRTGNKTFRFPLET